MADRDGHTVYCAGPMFSQDEVSKLRSIAATLQAAGFNTYLPPEDGVEVAKFMQLLKGDTLLSPGLRVALDWIRKMVFALDIYQLLERCDCLLFNMDGRVPDDGSVSEAAAAFAAGRAIVIYKTSPITMLANRDNPMVQGLSYTWRYVDDVTEIPQAMHAILSLLQHKSHGGGSSYTPSPQVAKVIAVGDLLWQVLMFLKAQGVRDGAVGRATRGPVEKPEELAAVVEPFTAKPTWASAWASSGLQSPVEELAHWFATVFQLLAAGHEPSPDVATKLADQLTTWAMSSQQMQSAFPDSSRT